ncbi:MAG: transcription termination factor NusA [Anaerolineales bacterium]|jgi:N utilization substance protein A
MKSEFKLAINEITERFGLSRETVMEALEAAMVSAYRRAANASSAQEVEAKLDLETGGVQILAEKEVVDSVENVQTEVALKDARQVEPDAEPGDMVMVESTPTDFGRVAAQTAKQVILQRLREAEREAQYAEFAEREGEMVHGTVHSITPQAVTIGLGRAEAILPRNQQIPGEHFRVRDRVRVYVLEVRKSSRGPVIIVSRTHPNMLRRLLEMEVPEINQGLVEIKAIAREAGKRAKVAVAALADGVDPVGACVGLRGVRIQSIVRDLNDEKIDVIEWNSDPATFIAKALSPARVSGVFLDDDPDRGKTAMVVVPEDQLSLAIGRAGVNARLGARLTGWRIDIKSLPEAASDSLHILQSDETYAEIAVKETETMAKVESILAKKAEGRPIPPEDYQILNGFVDRIQGEGQARRDAKRQARLDALEEVRSEIPEGAYQTELEDTELSTRVANLLTDAGYTTAGQVLEQLAIDDDEIRNLSGVGPKSIDEMQETLEGMTYVVPEPEPEEVPEIEAEAEVEAEAEAPEAVAEGKAEAAEEAEAAVAAEPAEAEAAEQVEGAPVGAEAKEAEVEEEVEEGDEIEKVFEAVEERLGISDEEEEEFEDLEDLDEEDEDDQEEKDRSKQRRRVVEFDPELGEVIVRRRRKPSRRQDEWEDTTF